MAYNIPTQEQAETRLASLQAEFPEGPPGMAGSGKAFTRFAVERYANGNRDGFDGWGIVVKWAYSPPLRPDLVGKEFGGAFVWFEHGRPTRWNFN